MDRMIPGEKALILVREAIVYAFLECGGPVYVTTYKDERKCRSGYYDTAKCSAQQFCSGLHLTRSLSPEYIRSVCGQEIDGLVEVVKNLELLTEVETTEHCDLPGFQAII